MVGAETMRGEVTREGVQAGHGGVTRAGGVAHPLCMLL